MARRGTLALALSGAAALALGGCTSMGVTRMGVDRSDYTERLRETNKEQLLQNIVAMRYGDAPLFLEVTSVINQYSREGSAYADLTLAPPPDSSEGGVGGQVVLRETPTVTYTPLTGDRFARSMLSPIPPSALLGLFESGWSPEVLFRIAARSINNVDNVSRAPLFARPGDPQFEPVIQALSRLQRSGAIAFHIEKEGDQFVARTHQVLPDSAQDEADLAYLVDVLDLPGDGKGQFAIVSGGARGSPEHLAIGTRSMFEIFSEMAQGVELPGGPAVEGNPLIRVHSGQAAPAGAHVAVRQRDRWFWIDATDEQSKQVFLIAQVLLSLGDTSGGAIAPLVTIPTG